MKILEKIILGLLAVGLVSLAYWVWTLHQKLEQSKQSNKTAMAQLSEKAINNSPPQAVIQTVTSVVSSERKIVPVTYMVIADDKTKRLFADTDNTNIHFAVDGDFDLIVRAYPVNIYSNQTAPEALDAGEYFININQGILTKK